MRGGAGVLVVALTGMSSAGQSSLEPGDVVHAVNGKAVDSVDALRSALASLDADASFVLQIERARSAFVSHAGSVGRHAAAQAHQLKRRLDASPR